jgi:hypothetical protein
MSLVRYEPANMINRLQDDMDQFLNAIFIGLFAKGNSF